MFEIYVFGIVLSLITAIVIFTNMNVWLGKREGMYTRHPENAWLLYIFAILMWIPFINLVVSVLFFLNFVHLKKKNPDIALTWNFP